ncbi:MAG TPA: hypothetical protein VGI78_11630 [Acetobacteraceae bacterium]|jgi:hypothetical protein
MTLSVTLTAQDGLGVGVLADHPARPQVITQRVPGATGEAPRLRVDLFDGRAQIGGGVLHAERGVWRGTCSEFAGTWHVSGACGSGVLEFRERAP